VLFRSIIAADLVYRPSHGRGDNCDKISPHDVLVYVQPDGYRPRDSPDLIRCPLWPLLVRRQCLRLPLCLPLCATVCGISFHCKLNTTIPVFRLSAHLGIVETRAREAPLSRTFQYLMADPDVPNSRISSLEFLRGADAEREAAKAAYKASLLHLESVNVDDDIGPACNDEQQKQDIVKEALISLVSLQQIVSSRFEQEQNTSPQPRASRPPMRLGATAPGQYNCNETSSDDYDALGAEGV